MRRWLPLLLLLPLLAVLPRLGDLFDEPAAPLPEAAPAPPQRVELGWVERFPAEGPALVFEVRALAVTGNGWAADVAVRNDTDVDWRLEPSARSFGVMLFASAAQDDLQRLVDAGDLPGLRNATAYRPPPRAVIEAGTTWAGRISAPGSLAAGRWVRLAFGTLTTDEPPAGLPSSVQWITDHAYRLRS